MDLEVASQAKTIDCLLYYYYCTVVDLLFPSYSSQWEPQGTDRDGYAPLGFTGTLYLVSGVSKHDITGAA